MGRKNTVLTFARVCLLLMGWELFLCPCHGLLSLRAEAEETAPACCGHCAAKHSQPAQKESPQREMEGCEEGCCAPWLLSETQTVPDFPMMVTLAPVGFQEPIGFFPPFVETSFHPPDSSPHALYLPGLSSLLI